MTESKKKAIADLKLLESKAYLDGDIELAQEYRILIGFVESDHDNTHADIEKDGLVNSHNDGTSTSLKTN